MSTKQQKRKRAGPEAALADEPVKRGITCSNASVRKTTRGTKTKTSRKCAKMEFDMEEGFPVEELVNDAQMNNFSHGVPLENGDAGPSSSSTGFLNLPGFRFSPKDDELVGYWLRAKCEGVLMYDVISVVNLYAHEPWELPDMCKLGGGDIEWYFFTYRGAVTNRGTTAGYWKATGRDREIQVCGKRMGMKKTLVFYQGRAPNGTRTDWVMHEYRMEEAAAGRDAGWVVCRVTDKTGLPAQRNARQRGVGGSRVEEAYNLLHALQPPLPPAVAPMAAADNDNGFIDRHEEQEEEQKHTEAVALALPPPSLPNFSEEELLNVADFCSVPDDDEDGNDDAKLVFQAFHVVEDHHPVTFPRLSVVGHPGVELLMGGPSTVGKKCLETGTGGAAVTAVPDEYECNSEVFNEFSMEGPIDLDALGDFDRTPPQSPVVVVDDLSSPLAAPHSVGNVRHAREAEGVEQERVYVDGACMVDLMCGGTEAASSPAYAVGDGVCSTPESDEFLVMVGEDFEMEELLTIVGSTTGHDDEEVLVEGLSYPPMEDDICDWLLPNGTGHY